MKALIDADIVAYRCAASAENDPLDIAFVRIDRLMGDIIWNTEADGYQAFLSGEANFRKIIYPDYKANRKDMPRPQWLQQCREYMIQHWDAVMTDGYEADDAIGIAATTDPTAIVCSIDKDLKQLPGRHYNFVTNEFQTVTYLEGVKNFYKQFLIGDKADNIPGIRGIGKVKAARIVDPLEDETEIFTAIRDIFDDDERLLLTGRLLWILREEEGYWKFPQVQEPVREPDGSVAWEAGDVRDGQD